MRRIAFTGVLSVLLWFFVLWGWGDSLFDIIRKDIELGFWLGGCVFIASIGAAWTVDGLWSDRERVPYATWLSAICRMATGMIAAAIFALCFQRILAVILSDPPSLVATFRRDGPAVFIAAWLASMVVYALIPERTVKAMQPRRK